MFLQSIELYNFKSYVGLHKIGPFKPFTSIIGPNGSGKSNLMEAICFVLGVKTQHLRGSRLEYLVSNVTIEDKSVLQQHAHQQHTFVKAVFVYEGQTVFFERRITSSGSSEYSINGHKLMQSDYVARLEDINVIARARNFLIFQGDVESIINKTDKELAEHLEQICGSYVYKAQVEEAQRLFQIDQAKTNQLKTKKREVQLEKKHYSEQNKDTEMFKELQTALSDITVQWMLFKFHTIDQLFDNNVNVLKEHANTLQTKTQSIQRLEASSKVLRIEHAKIAKESDAFIQQHKSVLLEIESLGPENTVLQDHITISTRKIADNNNKIHQLTQLDQKNKTDVDTHKSELIEAQHMLDSLIAINNSNNNISGNKDGSIHNTHQLAEYKRLKKVSDEKTTQLTSQIRAIKTQIVEKETDVKREKAKMKMQREEVLAMEAISHQVSDRLKRLNEYAANLKLSQTQINTDLKHATQSMVKATAEIALTNQKLDQINTTLGAVKSDKHESKREEEFNRLVDTLTLQFPNYVHGKLINLCSVADARYHGAISVVLGRSMNSIVVEDEATAHACIAYIKSQKIPLTAVFLPLHQLKVQPVNEAFRSLGGTARLAMDLIEVKAGKFKKVIEYACGNTVICDSYEEAKQIRMVTNRKAKCVTKDGTLIRKNGVMTGGNLYGLQQQSSIGGAGSSRFTLKNIADLKRDKATYMSRLNELSTINYTTQIRQYESQLIGIEQKLNLANQDIEATNTRLSEIHLKIDRNAMAQDTIQQQINACQSSISDLQQSLDALIAQRESIINTIFKSFCKSLKIKTIKEYEQTSVADEEERLSKIASLNNVISCLLSQIALLESRSKKEQIQSLYAAIESEQQRVAAYTNRQVDNNTKLAKAQRELDGINKQSESYEKTLKLKDTEIKESRKRIQMLSLEKTDIQKKINKSLGDIDVLKSQRHSLTTHCRVEEYAVPTLSGSFNNSQDIGADNTNMDGGMDRMLSSVTITTFSQETLDSLTTNRFGDHIILDYSLLDANLKTIMQPVDIGILNTQFDTKVKELATQLDSISPNLGALDKLEVAEARLAALDSEAKDVLSKQSQLTTRYNEANDARLREFKAAFNHVQKAVADVYKDLTIINNMVNNQMSSVNGQAVLVCSDMSNPFDRGISFHASPPNKPLRPISELSGGEKTIAAVALLFALQSYKPAPFFVLDEIDAALDRDNVERVANYLRTRTQSNFQAIVISLKENFYSKADALAGIYKDRTTQSSGCITLDLAQYN